jgi:hypothetical protein
MTTWLPKNYVSLFLVGLPDDKAAFYIHGTQQMYSVSCNLEMPKLPDGTILCVNYTEDVSTDSESRVVKTPRMLLFDIVLLNGEELHVGAEKRYEILRGVYDQFFKPIPSVTTLVALQWVGYNTHADAFIDGTVNVHHAVGGLMALTDNPLRPIRTIRIKLPMIVFDQRHFLNEQKHAPYETMSITKKFEDIKVAFMDTTQGVEKPQFSPTRSTVGKKLPPEMKLPPPEMKLPPPEIHLPPPEIQLPPPQIHLPPPQMKLPPAMIFLRAQTTPSTVPDSQPASCISSCSTDKENRAPKDIVCEIKRRRKKSIVPPERTVLQRTIPSWFKKTNSV